MGRLGYPTAEHLSGWGEREINRCLSEEEGKSVSFIILAHFFCISVSFAWSVAVFYQGVEWRLLRELESQGCMGFCNWLFRA